MLNTLESQRSSHFCVAPNHATLWITINCTIYSCSGCNSSTNGHKIKMLSSGYFISLNDDFSTKSTVKSKSFIIFARHSTYEHFFKKIVFLEIAWVGGTMVSSQLKTKKPYLWHIQLFQYVNFAAVNALMQMFTML